MKSRPRFFDKTVLKKDITRFAPAWVLYSVMGVMIACIVLRESGGERNAANVLNTCVGIFSVISMVYSFIVAQLLFGDLFKSQLCNALHALPLRREGWFLTHITAGLLFGFVPNGIIALFSAIFCGTYWYAAFLWLAGMLLHYTFFFGLSVFCIHLTGQRFAAVVVYGICNFLFIVLAWLTDVILIPMFFGLQLDMDPFILFSPVVELCQAQDYFQVAHLSSCPCTWEYYDMEHMYAFRFPGDDWTYLLIAAFAGLVFLALALILYRRRKLERAGDFVAFRKVQPLFWILFSLCAGCFLQLVASLFTNKDDPVTYLFLAIGILIGFFVSKMFLQRSIKVFSRRNFLSLGIFVLVLIIILGTAWLDPLGVTQRIPDTDQVEKAYVVRYQNDKETIYRMEDRGDDDCLVLTDPEGIDAVRHIHQTLLTDRSDYGVSYTIHYKLKNGTTLTRYYTVPRDSYILKGLAILAKEYASPLKQNSLESLKSSCKQIISDQVGLITGSRMEKLLEALWADQSKGSLYQNEFLHDHKHYGEYYYLTLYFDKSQQGFSIYDCCSSTQEWISLDRKNLHKLLTDTDLLTKELTKIKTPTETLTDPEDIGGYSLYLTELYADGMAVTDGYYFGDAVTLYLRDGTEYTLILPDKSSL